MKINQFLAATAAVYALGSATVAFAGAHASGDDPVIEGEGACTYISENTFAGPDKVCQEPVGAESCAALGAFADNADAVHSEGACDLEGHIGTCDLGSTKVHYLSGDPGGYEIGCSFQGGDWIAVE